VAVPIGTGTKLGQYEVQDFIGQGAMGLVYRAYHSELERTGAVKVMQAISPDADSVARFRHEAQAIAQMRHPNIVSVYDFGEFQGTPYMIVEYVPGGNLSNRMSDGRLDEATSLKYLRGIAAGLDHAHSHGIVHRDVKPANVLLTPEDTPVLVDFGLAKLLQGSSLKSMTGVTTGTPAYMAPEQVAGSHVGPAADRYALASIAYEMLTGVIPFDGEGLMELLYAQVHREPLPPSSRYPLLSSQVDAVVMRGLAKDPAARWESCSGFVDALSTALAGTSAPAMAQTVLMAPQVASTVPLVGAAVAERVAAPPQSRTVAMPYPAAQPVAPTAGVKQKPRRRTRVFVALGVIVALLLLLLFVRAAAFPPTTLTVSPSTVVAGESVVVSADDVPANQVGEIQLWSVLRTFAFRASANGQVGLTITVPRDIGFGDHLVKICWGNTCHAQQTLHVVSRLALVTPTLSGAASNPSPGGSSSATPGATPGSTPSPGSSPKPSPTPPNPCPTSTQSAHLTTSPATVIAGVTTVTVAGQNFTPNKQVIVNYYFPSTSSTPKRSWTPFVQCNGTFSIAFIPGTLDIGTAKVTANDAGGRFASTTFSIT
jgi:serine/threonine-protein kinase